MTTHQIIQAFCPPYACLLALGLAGCASPGPCLNTDSTVGPAPVAVYSSPLSPGQRLTWGGRIIATRNQAHATQIEAIAYPLDDCGRPQTNSQPLGRFLVRQSGYLEPLDYTPGRLLTASGQFAGIVEEASTVPSLTLPTLNAATLHLWQRQRAETHRSEAPWRPTFNIGIGGGSGHIGGGIGVTF